MTVEQSFQPWWKCWLRNNWKALTIAGVFFSLGLYLGWRGQKEEAPHTRHNHGPTIQAPKKKTIWTCSMHPQIRMPKPGKCPICFMDLIPLQDDGGQNNPKQLAISEATKTLAEIRTSRVQRLPVSLDVRMVGKVAYDETLVKTITAWIPGRLERMYVDYTGVRVRRGDHLVKIYSPELLAAQQELLQALIAWKRAQKSSRLTRDTARLGLDAARRKLNLLGVRKWQLRKIEKRGRPLERINIYAPLGGIVVHKKALEGMYVKTGTHLYTIADLSKVWIKFDVFERDLPWLHIGQKVTFKTLAMPGQHFDGKIVYIDPVLDNKTRTVSVRVNATNEKGLLKPDMFVQGVVHVSLDAQGQARIPERGGKYVCPMHPEIISKKRTRCPICGMRLERIKVQKSADDRDPLVIPKTAPLLTGRRAVVYVEIPKQKKPTYEGREVTLGAQADDYYVVLKGIKEGENVVSHGAFKLDSELQLQAKPSMMSVAAKKANEDITTVLSRPQLSQTVLKKLDPIYKTYFALTSMLIKDNPKMAQREYQTLQKQLKVLRVLPGKARDLWTKRRSRLFAIAMSGAKQSNVKEQRKTYEDLSKEIIALERSIGHSGMTPYYLAFCPMAFNNKGAYWLQTQKSILNPYFGKKMLRCGEVKATYIAREAEPVKTPRKFLQSLSTLYQPYFALQHALFKDHLKGSLEALQAMKKSLRQRRSRMLARSMRRRWDSVHSSLRAGVTLALKKKGIEQIRMGFEEISKGMLQLVFIFGHMEKTPIFETYCPMAFNNKGAVWLQPQDKQVRNSYFGAKMAFCGTVKRRFAPRVEQ